MKTAQPSQRHTKAVHSSEIRTEIELKFVTTGTVVTWKTFQSQIFLLRPLPFYPRLRLRRPMVGPDVIRVAGFTEQELSEVTCSMCPELFPSFPAADVELFKDCVLWLLSRDELPETREDNCVRFKETTFPCPIEEELI